MNQIVKYIINEINDAQIQKGRELMLYEMRPIMEKHIAKIERPKGEWAEHNTCPFCNHTYDWEYNFCPNCGADLRGDIE